jgi:hypothetical protein
LEVLNSRGELQWKAKLPKPIEAIKVADMESDGVQELVVGSEDGNMYVYDSTGIMEWYYPTGAAIYSLNPLDIDRNGYTDVVVGSTGNVTLYEMNIDYVLRQSAKSFYDKAGEYFSNQDYTIAMIYVAKSKDIYLNIRDMEGVTRCDVLIRQINDELKSRKKSDADAQYDMAVAAYGRNDINNSLVFLQSARNFYVELNDSVGVNKCDSFKQEIEKFMISEKAVTAEFHYARGLNYLSFRNYTEALKEARTARGIYQEIGYYNGTLLSSRLITSIADSYYTDAQLQMSIMKFNISLIYAEMAMELYNETKSYDGTAKTELLIQEIRRKMVSTPVGTTQKADYTLIIYLILGIVVILVILQLLKKRGGSTAFKSPEIKEPKTPF